jgi:hypothetical protein
LFDKFFKEVDGVCVDACTFVFGSQWSWRARRDEKKIFGLDGQEDVQQV